MEDVACYLNKKVDFSYPVFTSPSEAALTELSLPPPLPTPVPPTHIYIYICMFCVFLSICPSVSLSGDALQTTGDLVKSQGLLKLNVHYYPLSHNSWQVFFSRMHIQCFNQKQQGKGIVKGLQG